MHEMTNENRQNAITAVTKAFDQVVDAFDNDFTLGWTVEEVNAVAWEFGDANMESWPVYYSTINLVCKLLHTN